MFTANQQDGQPPAVCNCLWYSQEEECTRIIELLAKKNNNFSLVNITGASLCIFFNDLSGCLGKDIQKQKENSYFMNSKYCLSKYTKK